MPLRGGEMMSNRNGVFNAIQEMAPIVWQAPTSYRLPFRWHCVPPRNLELQECAFLLDCSEVQPRLWSKEEEEALWHRVMPRRENNVFLKTESSIDNTS